MTKLDRLRESNPIEVQDDWPLSPDGSDAFTAIRSATRDPEALSIDPPAKRRKPWVYLLAGFASALAIAIPTTILLMSGGGPDPLSQPQIPSARIVDEILEDGIVTDAELTRAAEAVIACVRENGGDLEREAEVEVGTDGSFTYTMVDGESPLFQRCELTILDGVSRVWARQNQPPRASGFYLYGGAVACTEQRSGTDFGEMTRDPLGFVSTVGHRTINAAIDAEPEIYDDCFEALLDEVGIYSQVLQCVAERSTASLGAVTGNYPSPERPYSQIDEEGFAVLDDALTRFPDQFEQCLGSITAEASLETGGR